VTFVRAEWRFVSNTGATDVWHSPSDGAGAEALVRDDWWGRTRLARIREQAGDSAYAERLRRQAVDRGDYSALEDLAWSHKQAGDAIRADQIMTLLTWCVASFATTG
jgi:hypothetical protein